MTFPHIEGMPNLTAATTPADQILYITGNGFDLHHCIDSSYKAFGRYLQAVDCDTYRELVRYFSVDDDFWWQFEAQLANLDTDALIDDTAQFLASYGDEDWSDAGHHDYQYELDRVVEAISKTLRQRFGEWIRQLVIPMPAALNEKLLPLRRDARYLSFNYTNTLQRVYGIPDANVVHIHGAAAHIDEQLILGHGWQRTPADSLNHAIDPSEADIRVMEGNDIIDRYFSETFKPTTHVIQVHQSFFRSLTNVRKIIVMGHSLSPVDIPYLRELCAYLDSNAVEWQVSFHESSADAEDGMHELGVPLENVQFVPLMELSCWACP